MNFLIVASKEDTAGMNIAKHVRDLNPKLPLYIVEKDILHTENLDLKKISQFDFIIFASKHKSQKEEKALTVHAPGNWRNADFGGEKKKLCPTSACFLKQIFQELHKQKEASHLKDYQVTLEATHHGPLINKPCVFIEIGATEREWKDSKAGFAVAKTIIQTVENFKHNPYNEYCIGIGGPHYCSNFNKLQLESNFAISHVLPSYDLPADETMIREAVMKMVEDLDFILLDWKGLGNAEQRKQLTDLLDKMNLSWRRIDKIGKEEDEDEQKD